LAALLREQRETRGLSLRQASFQAQLAPSTLSRWESGTTVPRVPELEGLLRALGVDGEDVLRILVSLNAPRAVKAVRSATDPSSVAPSGGALLHALRSKARLSLADVAHALGVAASTVSRWEASTAHPSPQAAEALLDLVQATTEERQCLVATGVAKIQVERPVYDRARYEAEIGELEIDVVRRGHEGLELRLLQLQSLLWWALREPGAPQLLWRAHVAYAQFLCQWERYPEALIQARAVGNGVIDSDDEWSFKARRVLARADVYRWPAPRPHIGLFSLQSAMNAAPNEAIRSELLADMADYSRLANRNAEAQSYADRAVAAAISSGDEECLWQARGAQASAFASQGRLDEALPIFASGDAPLHVRAHFAMRSGEALAYFERFEAARQAYERVLAITESGTASYLRRIALRLLSGPLIKAG